MQHTFLGPKQQISENSQKSNCAKILWWRQTAVVLVQWAVNWYSWRQNEASWVTGSSVHETTSKQLLAWKLCLTFTMQISNFKQSNGKDMNISDTRHSFWKHVLFRCSVYNCFRKDVNIITSTLQNSSSALSRVTAADDEESIFQLSRFLYRVFDMRKRACVVTERNPNGVRQE